MQALLGARRNGALRHWARGIRREVGLAARLWLFGVLLVFVVPADVGAAPVGTAFTYQGRLTDGGSAAVGSYDFQFGLFDAATAGTQIGATLSQPGVSVSQGLFTVSLDFGAGAFNGDARWLEVAVRKTGTATFTTLTPRQSVTTAPYAQVATTAWSQVGNAGTSPATNFLGTTDAQPLNLRTNNTNRVTIDQNGNVGIGTTTPAFPLHVGTNQSVRFELGPSNALSLSSQGDFAIDAPFVPAGRFVVKTSGNVGVGTSTPTRPLEVNGVVGLKDAGSAGHNAGLTTEVSAALIEFGINDGSANRFGGTFTSADQGGFLRIDTRAGAPLFGFFARPAGGTSDVGQVATLSNNGSLQLGGGARFQVDAPFVSAGHFLVTETGNVGISHNAPTHILQVLQNSPTEPIADAWTVYSSRRWKTDVRPIEDAVSLVQRLRGVRFAWRADGRPDVGLIAEEVGAVIPEVVSWDPNGVDAEAVDYSRLVAVLIEATKVQQSELDQQSAQLAQQQAELDQQTAQIAQHQTQLAQQQDQLARQQEQLASLQTEVAQLHALEARLDTLERGSGPVATAAAALPTDPSLSGWALVAGLALAVAGRRWRR